MFGGMPGNNTVTYGEFATPMISPVDYSHHSHAFGLHIRALLPRPPRFRLHSSMYLPNEPSLDRDAGAHLTPQGNDMKYDLGNLSMTDYRSYLI
jgi:hypothetical protein